LGILEMDENRDFYLAKTIPISLKYLLWQYRPAGFRTFTFKVKKILIFLAYCLLKLRFKICIIFIGLVFDE